MTKQLVILGLPYYCTIRNEFRVRAESTPKRHTPHFRISKYASRARLCPFHLFKLLQNSHVLLLFCYLLTFQGLSEDSRSRKIICTLKFSFYLYIVIFFFQKKNQFMPPEKAQILNHPLTFLLEVLESTVPALANYFIL